MKIVHISLIGPVTDNWTYQENILPKYQKLNNYEVVMITSKYIYDKKGNIIEDERDEYNNEHGIKTIRLELKKPYKFKSKFKKYRNLFETIDKENPDILFVHGVQFRDVSTIVKYCKKNPKIKVYVDSHADFSNSGTNWISKNILHKIIWKYYAKKICKYTTKFWGVLPSRADFLHNMYRIPKNKIGLLVMGADDELVEASRDEICKEKIREKHGISKDDILIVTGGKIDSAKYQTLLLMDSFNKLDNNNVKMIVFGPVSRDLKDDFNKKLTNKITYIPWLDNIDSYKYFSAADLVVFPGRHSVYWEVVAGLGVPMIVRKWEGTTHISNGENVKYITDDKIEKIYEPLLNILTDKKELQKMKKAANNNFKNKFLYSNIARESVEDK